MSACPKVLANGSTSWWDGSAAPPLSARCWNAKSNAARTSKARLDKGQLPRLPVETPASAGTARQQPTIRSHRVHQSTTTEAAVPASAGATGAMASVGDSPEWQVTRICLWIAAAGYRNRRQQPRPPISVARAYCLLFPIAAVGEARSPLGKSVTCSKGISRHSAFRDGALDQPSRNAPLKLGGNLVRT